MKIQEAIKKYLDKEMTALELIRLLTGIFNSNIAVDLLALINQICRHEAGELDTATFRAIYKIES